MSRHVASQAEESTPMSKWLVLPMVVIAYLAASATASAPRDRDHDRLPDRWERKYHLSSARPSAKRDPDRDRLINRRELRRHTHPRRADTDGDHLLDGAEVRHFHTNPRKRDTDRDGFWDRCELRSGTNPRKRRSRPTHRCSESPLGLVAPPSADADSDGDGVRDTDDVCPMEPGPASNYGCPIPSTGYPDASNTGVPPGITLVPSGGLTINTAGTVIDGRDISGPVVVNAPNVTIRRSRIRTTSFWAVDNNSTGLLIEDSEIDGLNANGTCIGSSNLTVRRANIHGCENGFNVTGTATVEDSYIHDLTTANGAHTDGAQFGQGASDVVFRHNTMVSQSGSTSCIIMWNETDPQNTRVQIVYNRLIGTGAAYTLYAPRRPASQIYINNNRFKPGVFGTTDSLRVGTTVTEFKGNVRDDTGQPLSPGR
jgi:hypothetical protein